MTTTDLRLDVFFRTLNGAQFNGRVYVDVRDVTEMLRAIGYSSVANSLVEWETKWTAFYSDNK